MTNVHIGDALDRLAQIRSLVRVLEGASGQAPRDTLALLDGIAQVAGLIEQRVDEAVAVLEAVQRPHAVA